MADKKYKIVITGKFVAGASPERAIAAFAQLFKLDIEKAKTIFAEAPKVIKTDVDAATAKTFIEKLKLKGVDVRAEPLGGGANSLAEPSSHGAIMEPARVSNTPKPSQADAATGADTSIKSVYEPKDTPGLKFKVEGKPDYALLTVQIPADHTLKVEASAMAAMDPHIKMKTKIRGGFKRFLTGENIFLNELTAQQVPGELVIAPGTPGDLAHRYLNGDTIFLQNSAYVASTEDVTIETKWQGLVKGFFSGESLFLIRCSGTGDLWFNTYGAIIEIDVNGDYVVDTGNIVAFTEGLEYKISKVGGYKSLFFSGEGLVCRFSGSGKVWIQTRGTAAFTHWAHWYRPVKKRG